MYLYNLFFQTTLTALKKANKILKSHDSAHKMFTFPCLQKIYQSRETFPFSTILRITTFQPSNISSRAGFKAAVFRAAPPERVPPAAARGCGLGRGGGGPGGGPEAAGRGRRHPPQPRPSAPPHQTRPRRA